MMFSSSRPMGHYSSPQMKMASMNLANVQMNLERQKRMPVNAEAYLDILNRLLEPLAIVKGPMGLRTWLAEVQYFMGLMKQRSFSGRPLTPRERQVLVWYSARWRELRGGPCDMGRPEAQIVLIALGELSRF
ncbi:hypothetical protein I302_103317 [Kwoniella bestiolae CBS 10118]|uniref:Uncharacterized protein n=1 Tax=Kwoniella bestiolae CBS 10118 TaxID=1296100 RepID=A0A1B9G838_9TREE|nr:hypothetical protein I302_02020 [Kwoniella bestiolae CBS 10118]OCF27182.1 hypothetical protein I302_02020 [Kwoniella bestiolae CBS 10118]